MYYLYSRSTTQTSLMFFIKQQKLELEVDSSSLEM